MIKNMQKSKEEGRERKRFCKNQILRAYTVQERREKKKRYSFGKHRQNIEEVTQKTSARAS